MEYINEHLNKMISFEDMELLDMEKVISALSFYLNYNTENYHYNHAFLPSNFKDFQESVKFLQHKNTIYEDIMDAVKESMSQESFFRKIKILLDQSFCIEINTEDVCSKYVEYSKSQIEKMMLSMKVITVDDRENEKILLIKKYSTDIECVEIIMNDLEKILKQNCQEEESRE